MATEEQMSRTYMVQMPTAEARHLAGTGHNWPATSEIRLAFVIREWPTGISRRRSAIVPVRKVIADLSLILETAPLPKRPLRGPFGPGRTGPPLPGLVEYLGGGIVRLDEAAVSSLAGLAPDDDFHISRTAAGPVLTVGFERYLAREEEPDPRSSSIP
jgi:hypothetical protein